MVNVDQNDVVCTQRCVEELCDNIVQIWHIEFGVFYLRFIQLLS